MQDGRRQARAACCGDGQGAWPDPGGFPVPKFCNSFASPCWCQPLWFLSVPGRGGSPKPRPGVHQPSGKKDRSVRTLPAGSEAQPLLRRHRMGLKIAGLAAAQIRSKGCKRRNTSSGHGAAPTPLCPAATPSWGRGQRCHPARGFVLPEEGSWGDLGPQISLGSVSWLGHLFSSSTAARPVHTALMGREERGGSLGAGGDALGRGQPRPCREEALAAPALRSSRSVRSRQLIPELLRGPAEGQRGWGRTEGSSPLTAWGA